MHVTHQYIYKFEPPSKFASPQICEMHHPPTIISYMLDDWSFLCATYYMQVTIMIQWHDCVNGGSPRPCSSASNPNQSCPLTAQQALKQKHGQLDLGMLIREDKDPSLC